jgi:hypothetical protein
VDILKDIAEHFEELNMRWLLTGDGEMLDHGKKDRKEAGWAVAEPAR